MQHSSTVKAGVLACLTGCLGYATWLALDSLHVDSTAAASVEPAVLSPDDSPDALAQGDRVGETVILQEGTSVVLPSLYLGQIATSAPKKFRLPMQNNTGRTVEVHVENVSCGCLSLRSSPPAIEPGAVGFLEGFLDARGRSHGFVSQSAICVFSGLADSQVNSSFKVLASVPGYWAVPGTLTFTSENIMKNETLDFTVFLIGPGELGHTQISSDSPSIEITSRSEVNTKEENTGDPKSSELVNSRRFNVRFLEKGPILTERGALKIRVPQSPGPPLSVPLIAQKMDLIRSVPARGLLVGVSAGETAAFEFRLSTNGIAESFDWSRLVLKVDVPSAVLELQPQSETKGEAALRVSVPINGKITRGEVHGRYDNKDALAIPILIIRQDS